MIKCKNQRNEWVTLPREKFRFRPSVYGIIRNPEGKICVCRNMSDGKLWFPGGGINVGETRKDALLREIKEETGLQGVIIGECLSSVENFFFYEPTDEAMHAFLFFYDCKTTDTKLKGNDQVEDDEARDFQWIDPAQVKKDDFSDMQEEIMALLQLLEG
jgi:8-oxo-dGTP diphosphatase